MNNVSNMDNVNSTNSNVGNMDNRGNVKKKNTLLVVFLMLLVVFVCFMCYVVIYAKQHPPKEYLSQDEIEVKQMVAKDYVRPDTLPTYTEYTDSTDYVVTRDNEEFNLIVEDEKVKLFVGEEKKDVVLKLNDGDINNNIKLIYQNSQESLILTNDGNLYRSIDNTISSDNTINVGQILNNTKVSSIILILNASSMYAKTVDDFKFVNVNTNEEYNGIINELDINGGTIYVYENYYFGIEEGKVFVNDLNVPITVNMIFENKLIDIYGTVYDIDFVNKAVSTSKLGVMSKIGYNRGEDNIYTLGLETNTGNYTFRSEYYYTK